MFTFANLQDEKDRQWYALRFPPGGSGFVIDSALFSRVHAVHAQEHTQQSVLAVFNKQGSDHRMVCEALAKMAAGLVARAIFFKL